MDFTDLLIDNAEETFTGYYYDKKPKVNDGRVSFKYTPITPKSKEYAMLTGTLYADSETYQIKTNDGENFKIGGYISTQDGRLWQIQSISHNELKRGSEEATIFFKYATETEYQIRMTKVDNITNI